MGTSFDLTKFQRYWSIYSKDDYTLVQQIIFFLGLIGFVGHFLFYYILKYFFGTWESLLLRTITAFFYLSLLLLPNDRTRKFTTIHKYYFEFMLAFTLPFFFNFLLIENDVNTYWAASVIFSTIIYGLFANPAKALIIYPISLVGALIATKYFHGIYISYNVVVRVIQVNFAAYFMVALLGVVQAIIKHAYAIIEKERSRSDELLHSILPVSIADQLKSNPKHIADKFEKATILFADIVDFTALSEKLSPEELTSLLNQIFSRFDRLADKYGLEKIKTIGDAYMVAGGIPIKKENHAEAIMEMAIEIQSELEQFNLENNQLITIRVGIHTGPVVAGVIGTKKFSYDVWGDTVNTASRMESHGVSGQTQVSQQVYELLKEKYQFTERGNIDIKGKGQLKAYLLKGRLA